MEDAYGIKVPFTVLQVYQFDALKNYSLWRDAIEK